MSQAMVDIELTVGDDEDGYKIELRAAGILLHSWGPFDDRQVAQMLVTEIGEHLRVATDAVTLH